MGIWPITATEGARVDGACTNPVGVENSENSFFRASTRERCENSVPSGRLIGGMKSTKYMWVLWAGIT